MASVAAESHNIQDKDTFLANAVVWDSALFELRGEPFKFDLTDGSKYLPRRAVCVELVARMPSNSNSEKKGVPSDSKSSIVFCSTHLTGGAPHVPKALEVYKQNKDRLSDSKLYEKHPRVIEIRKFHEKVK